MDGKKSKNGGGVKKEIIEKKEMTLKREEGRT